MVWHTHHTKQMLGGRALFDEAELNSGSDKLWAPQFTGLRIVLKIDFSSLYTHSFRQKHKQLYPPIFILKLKTQHSSFFRSRRSAPRHSTNSRIKSLNDSLGAQSKLFRDDQTQCKAYVHIEIGICKTGAPQTQTPSAFSKNSKNN